MKYHILFIYSNNQYNEKLLSSSRLILHASKNFVIFLVKSIAALQIKERAKMTIISIFLINTISNFTFLKIVYFSF